MTYFYLLCQSEFQQKTRWHTQCSRVNKRVIYNLSDRAKRNQQGPASLAFRASDSWGASYQPLLGWEVQEERAGYLCSQSRGIDSAEEDCQQEMCGLGQGMESIHGSEGTTGTNTLISLSSHSLISCPCPPIGKIRQKAEAKQAMDTVHESQPPRTLSRVEKGGER